MKSVKQSLQDNAPWKPPAYELVDVTALQALQRGEADAELQQRALKWIIEKACGTYDMQYRPGEDGKRDTDFSLGRQFVGQQIVKLLRVDVSKLRRNDDA